MPIALVQSAAMVTGIGLATTAPQIALRNCTPGNCLVALASIFDGNTTWTIASVTDDGNSFLSREATATSGSSKNIASVAYAVGISGGDRTVKFNLAGTTAGAGRFYNIGLLEFSGVLAISPEDTWDGNPNIDTSVNDATAGPITTSYSDGDLLVGCISGNIVSDNAMNYGSPASWVNSYRQNAAFTTCGFDAGYWLSGAIQTNYTAQWSHDNNAGDLHGGVVVALKPALPILPRTFDNRGQGRFIEDDDDGRFNELDIKNWWRLCLS